MSTLRWTQVHPPAGQDPDRDQPGAAPPSRQTGSEGSSTAPTSFLRAITVVRLIPDACAIGVAPPRPSALANELARSRRYFSPRWGFMNEKNPEGRPRSAPHPKTTPATVSARG